jgi:N-acetylglucosaminyl-diphospho-decaprenol L-rhamnosyltransferase
MSATRWMVHWSSFESAGHLVGAACAAVGVPAIALSVAAADAIAAARRRVSSHAPQPVEPPVSTRVSIIILNWNGRDLLERGLPSALAAIRAGDEVMVVDNGSTDGSVAFVRENFPAVRLVELPRNLYFSGGNNVGVRAAINDIIVLLNSDMVVEPDFLPPLVAALAQPGVFAASAQIFLQDLQQPRHETGRTAADFQHGALNLAHLPVDDAMPQQPQPVLWAGGGSTAYDRRKFLALGGLDELYWPAYVEDLALSYAAWKRGWSSVFVPSSRVHHAHRGTSRRVFGDAYVDRLIARNQLLFIWRHMGWGHLARHLVWLPAHIAWLAQQHSARGAVQILLTALVRLPRVVMGRARDTSTRLITDELILQQGSGAASAEPFDPGSQQANVRVRSGWHPLEGGDPSFRWTMRRAEAWVNVQRVPAEIRVRGVVPDFVLNGRRPARVRLAVDGPSRRTHRLLGSGSFSETVFVSTGPTGWRRLSLEVERTHRPNAHGIGFDTRELGVQVTDITVGSPG